LLPFSAAAADIFFIFTTPLSFAILFSPLSHFAPPLRHIILLTPAVSPLRRFDICRRLPPPACLTFLPDATSDFARHAHAAMPFAMRHAMTDAASDFTPRCRTALPAMPPLFSSPILSPLPRFFFLSFFRRVFDFQLMLQPTRFDTLLPGYFSPLEFHAAIADFRRRFH
jgi:hypothetical protein